MGIDIEWENVEEGKCELEGYCLIVHNGFIGFGKGKWYPPELERGLRENPKLKKYAENFKAIVETAKGVKYYVYEEKGKRWREVSLEELEKALEVQKPHMIVDGDYKLLFAGKAAYTSYEEVEKRKILEDGRKFLEGKEGKTEAMERIRNRVREGEVYVIGKDALYRGKIKGSVFTSYIEGKKVLDIIRELRKKGKVIVAFRKGGKFGYVVYGSTNA